MSETSNYAQHLAERVTKVEATGRLRHLVTLLIVIAYLYLIGGALFLLAVIAGAAAL